jgi:hypothetical protein
VLWNPNNPIFVPPAAILAPSCKTSLIDSHGRGDLAEHHGVRLIVEHSSPSTRVEGNRGHQDLPA